MGGCPAEGQGGQAGNSVTKSHPVLLGAGVTAGRSPGPEPCWFSEPRGEESENCLTCGTQDFLPPSKLITEC